ncbi:MAG: phosphoglycolate phosphatase, partial [Candidatus Hydrothermarchaeales archaeon]
MIKALACDIDGTITDEERRLDLKAVRLLRKIEGMGIPVVLATGNVLCLTEAASTYIGTTGPVIAENGGIIKYPKEKKPLYFRDINKAELEEAFEHLNKLLPVRKVSRSDLRRTEIAIYRDFDVSVVREALEEFDVRVVDTKFAIHITDSKVNKGEALRMVAKKMGFKEEEFAAIGDSENDYEMLNAAGLAIAVGEERLKD